MKKSSIIFLVAFLAIIIGLIVLMSVIRYNLYNSTDNNEDYELQGIEYTEEIRDLEKFSAINTRKNIELIIKQDTFTEVKVVADREMLDYIYTEVKDEVLYIYSDSYKKNDKKGIKQKIRVNVTLRDLEKIEAYRGTLIKSIDTIKGKSLDILIDNGAICTFIVDYNSLTANISNGALLNAEGKINNLEIIAVNGGMYKGRELVSSYTKINASAGAIITVGKTNKIDVIAASGSMINYKTDSEINVIELGSGAQLMKY